MDYSWLQGQIDAKSLDDYTANNHNEVIKYLSELKNNEKVSDDEYEGLLQYALGNNYVNESEVGIIGSSNTDLNKSFAKDVLNEYGLIEENEEEKNGDFHYSREHLLKVVENISSANLSISSSKDIINNIKINDDFKYIDLNLLNYEDDYDCGSTVLSPMDALDDNDLQVVEEIKNDIIASYKEVDSINDDIARIVNAMNQLDPLLKKSVDDFAKKFTNKVYKSVLNNSTSLDIGQLSEFVSQYLDNDITKLSLDENETKLLQTILDYGTDKKKYEEGGFIYRAVNDGKAFVISVGEGMINTLEGTVDGAIFITGGLVSVGVGLIDEKAGEDVLHFTRKTIEKDLSADAYGLMCDCFDVNQVSSEKKIIRSTGNLIGSFAGDSIMLALPGGWIPKAIAEVGKQTEKISQAKIVDENGNEVDAFSDGLFLVEGTRYAVISVASNKLLNYTKCFKCVSASEAGRKAFTTVGINTVKSINQKYSDYEIAVASNKTESSNFGEYLLVENREDTIKVFVYDNLVSLTTTYYDGSRAKNELDYDINFSNRNEVIREFGRTAKTLTAYEKKVQKYLKYVDAVAGTKLSKNGIYNIEYDLVNSVYETTHSNDEQNATILA